MFTVQIGACRLKPIKRFVERHRVQLPLLSWLMVLLLSKLLTLVLLMGEIENTSNTATDFRHQNSGTAKDQAMRFRDFS